MREMRDLKCDRDPPIVVPWPHIVSRTGTTVVVALRADTIASAKRDNEDSSVVWLVAPGLV